MLKNKANTIFLRKVSKEFKIEWIINSLEDNGFEKGLTIKKNRDILYADEFTADIKYRRENN